MGGIKEPGVRSIILDMDGVLWRAEQPIGNLPEIFKQIEQRGCGVVMATNNSTHTAETFTTKLSNLGVRVEPWQIVNSSMALAHELHRRYPQGGPVFVLGEKSLEDVLRTQGFYHQAENPLAVVVGLDRQLTYAKLTQTALHLQAGLPFLATNADSTLPIPEGFAPGAGSILALLETATGVKPFIAGKPQPEIYKLALERLGTRPEETLVVGDRLETDIIGAQALGCRTAIVLSGVSTEEEAKSWQPAIDWVAPDLTALLESLWN